MPMNNIIDNRSEKLVDHILAQLPQAERLKFAVGYFFLSGLEALGKQLDAVKELRLLIGSVSDTKTIEQLSAGYKRLDLVEEELDRQRYAPKPLQKHDAERTADDLRETIAVMDQTDDGVNLVHALIRMITEQRLKVRVYTRGRLHAKAYLFDYSNPQPGNEGIAIVGSSNLTLSGISDNTELNVLVYDNGNPLKQGQGNHGKLTGWFEQLWNESLDFDAQLMQELQASWAARPATPDDVYLKTLYALVQDRLNEGESSEILWDEDITRSLAEFQKVAVRQAITMIGDHGGCFVADVVGLGKSYIGAAILKHFERVERARPLIICPKPLEDMWRRYNHRYDLHAEVVSLSRLRQGEQSVDLLHDEFYRDRDFVLIDESHNLRNSDTQSYQRLQQFLATGDRRVCLLTATPRNSSAWDVYHQIKLFHPDDRTDLPVDPPDLRAYFKLIEDGKRKLQDLLVHILIRRTRRHILRWYGYTEDSDTPMRDLPDAAVAPYLNGVRRAYVKVGTRRQFFPRRRLETLRYSIEETYNGLYDELRGYLGKPANVRPQPHPGEELTYARYGLWNYLLPEKKRDKKYADIKQAGINLRGLIRTMLFKRFESSVEAFRKTLERMIASQTMFLRALEQGFVPLGERAEALLGRDDLDSDEDLVAELERLFTGDRLKVERNISDFDSDLLKEHIVADLDLLERMLARVAPITPQTDDKLQPLLARVQQPPVAGQKCLIFTQYADTAEYLYRNLNPYGQDKAIEVIYGTDKSKPQVVGRFAPQANPAFAPRSGEPEIRILVATDVLAEGLNMQDCSIVLNYDLHWNPVRLIQRFGRIDRIGSEHDLIYGLNFLPERGIERNLGLTAVLQRRIAEIQETIGEDAAILDPTERINEQAMYAIYSGAAAELAGFDEDGSDELVNLNEVEELLRSMQQNDPDEFKRIAGLRDGIRAGTPSGAGARQIFVFCRHGRYQQLFLVDRRGRIISRDIPAILGALKAARVRGGIETLPDEYNAAVMQVKAIFDAEVQQRESRREYTQRLSRAQRYILKELRDLYAQAKVDGEPDRMQQIDRLEPAFRQTPTGALAAELNPLRRNHVTGGALLATLIDLYHQHRLAERLGQDQTTVKDRVSRIICSAALV